MKTITTYFNVTTFHGRKIYVSTYFQLCISYILFLLSQKQLAHQNSSILQAGKTCSYAACSEFVRVVIYTFFNILVHNLNCRKFEPIMAAATQSSQNEDKVDSFSPEERHIMRRVACYFPNGNDDLKSEQYKYCGKQVLKDLLAAALRSVDIILRIKVPLNSLGLGRGEQTGYTFVKVCSAKHI